MSCTHGLRWACCEKCTTKESLGLIAMEFEHKLAEAEREVEALRRGASQVEYEVGQLLRGIRNKDMALSRKLIFACATFRSAIKKGKCEA